MLGEFLECSTTAIGGLLGRGSVTLARWNGLPLPGDVWGANAIDVDYTLADLTTSPMVPKLEKGLGVVTDGVLARSLPRITWDGTTFDEDTPLAVAFGPTPAFGNVRVRIAPNADQFMQGPPAIWTASGGPFAGLMPTANLLGAPGTLAGNGLTLNADKEYYIPYLSAIRGNIISIGLYVTTPVALSHVKMGIYGVGTNGLPGPCIMQSQPINTALAGFRADGGTGSWLIRTGPLMLRCSWFYLGVLSDAAIEVGATTRSSLAGPTPLGMVDALGWGSLISRNTSNTYATGLPADIPAGPFTNPVSAVSSSVPTVFLGFSN